MPTILLAMVVWILLPLRLYSLQEQGHADGQSQKEQQSQPSKKKDDNPPIDPNKPGGARLTVTLRARSRASKLRPGENLVGVTDQDVRIADREIPKGSKVTVVVGAAKHDDTPEFRLLSVKVGDKTYWTHSEKAIWFDKGATERQTSKTVAGMKGDAEGGHTIDRTVVFLLKEPPELEDKSPK